MNNRIITVIIRNEFALDGQAYGVNRMSGKVGKVSGLFVRQLPLGFTESPGRLRDAGQAAIVAVWRFDESVRQDAGRSNRVCVPG